MVFSSAIFLFAFLPAVLILYRLIPTIKYKNILLALASLVFYAFGQLRYVPLFLLSVAINYGSGLLLMGGGEKRKTVLTLSVVLNLGILGLYKYADFTVSNLNGLLGTSMALPGIVLPIGISFFTFQGMSYTIDVYRDRDSGTRDFLKLLLYISFFPQLIAGPIVKYHDVAMQIDSRSVSPEELWRGIQRFIFGLAKKILLANAVGAVADSVFNECLPSGLTDAPLMWLGAVCYTLQIYFDFSGYSDMAIGLGRMFGFHFLENFRFPYVSGSLKEFWRRWHISLSSWFREYLYIPLGGNRKGKGRTVIHKLLVFFCTGIWHGANWTFVFWGMGHGILSSLEDLGIIPVKRLEKYGWGRVLGRVYTMLTVMLLFVVFRADSLAAAFAMIGAMFRSPVTAEGLSVLRSLLTPAACMALAAALLLCGRAGEWLHTRWEEKRGNLALSAVSSIALYLLSLCSLAGSGFNPFIYFQF